MATNQLYQQSEVMRTKLMPEWLMKPQGVLLDFFEKGEYETVGERDYRIPFKKSFGGRFGHYDPQMGEIGRAHV